MDQGAETTAADIINKYTQDELIRVLSDYGEFRNAKDLASAIVSYRTQTPVNTTQDLIESVREFIPARAENKFLSRLFQSLRIELNREIEFLKEMLIQATDMLISGGRIAVITYHSVEDRLVKNFLRSGNFEGLEQKDFYGNTESPYRLVNKRVITPSEKEIIKNRRARSAKLRIAEKK